MDSLIRKLPQVDGCCCGCELSTGAKFVGWYQTIVGAIVQLLGIGGIIMLSAAMKKIPQSDPDHDAKVAAVIVGIVMMVVLMVATLLWLILGIILLIGVNKNDKQKVRCWINVVIVLFIIGIISALLSFFKTVFSDPAMGFSRLVSSAVGAAINFYFIVVVKSYYVQLEPVFQSQPINQA